MDPLSGGAVMTGLPVVSSISMIAGAHIPRALLRVRLFRFAVISDSSMAATKR
jgi:hypothetical protein